MRPNFSFKHTGSYNSNVVFHSSPPASSPGQTWDSCPSLKHFNSNVMVWKWVCTNSQLVKLLLNWQKVLKYFQWLTSKSYNGVTIIQSCATTHDTLWHKSCGDMQSAANSSYSWEGFKEKISFIRLDFTGCASSVLVFQRHILSQTQSPS